MTQIRAEYAQQTRSRLVESARQLFTEHGYAPVTVEQIARHAGVTQGALYHHFTGKREVFSAVATMVGTEVVTAVAADLSEEETAWDAATSAIDSFLVQCLRPDVQRILYIDGPSVGWQQWREGSRTLGVSLVESILVRLKKEGLIATRSVRSLAHLLVGALNEAAIVIADAKDPKRTRTEMLRTLQEILRALSVSRR